MAVPGELEIVPDAESTGADYYFRPTTLLPVGSSYQVWVDELANQEGTRQTNRAFTITEPVTTDPSLVTAELSLMPGRVGAGSEACCDRVRDSCGNPYCLPSEWLNVLAFWAELVSGELDSGTQWRLRVHSWDGQGGQDTSNWAWGGVSRIIDEQQEQYCFEVEVESLVDGARARLGKQCVPHDGFPELTTEPAIHEPSPIAQCPEPFPGYEDLWCEGTAERCSSGSFPDACTRHTEHCDDGSSSSDPGSSCSLVHDAGPASRHLAWLLAAIGAAALAWNRRVRRARCGAEGDIGRRRCRLPSGASMKPSPTVTLPPSDR